LTNDGRTTDNKPNKSQDEKAQQHEESLQQKTKLLNEQKKPFLLNVSKVYVC